MSENSADILRSIAQQIASDNGLTVDEAAFDKLRDYMNEVTIDSNVRLPRSKKAKADNERNTAAFKRYADAYEAAHIKRPTLVCADGKHVTIDFGTHVSSYTEKRLRELTAMLRNRVRDR